MTRLAIVVEGDTEYNFIRDVLSKRLLETLPTLEIRTSNLGGGGISINSLQNEARRWLRSHYYVTTLVDYYKFKGSREKSVVDLENELAGTLRASEMQRSKFIPYIQKYEFEALVLATADILNDRLQQLDRHYRLNLGSINLNNRQPEEINHDHPPSAIIKEASNGKYIKSTHGIEILKAMNWGMLRERCPRFSQWIDRLESLPQ